MKSPARAGGCGTRRPAHSKGERGLGSDSYADAESPPPAERPRGFARPVRCSPRDAVRGCCLPHARNRPRSRYLRRIPAILRSGPHFRERSPSLSASRAETGPWRRDGGPCRRTHRYGRHRCETSKVACRAHWPPERRHERPRPLTWVRSRARSTTVHRLLGGWAGSIPDQTARRPALQDCPGPRSPHPPPADRACA